MMAEYLESWLYATKVVVGNRDNNKVEPRTSQWSKRGDAKPSAFLKIPL